MILLYGKYYNFIFKYFDYLICKEVMLKFNFKLIALCLLLCPNFDLLLGMEADNCKKFCSPHLQDRQVPITKMVHCYIPADGLDYPVGGWGYEEKIVGYQMVPASPFLYMSCMEQCKKVTEVSPPSNS